MVRAGLWEMEEAGRAGLKESRERGVGFEPLEHAGPKRKLPAIAGGYIPERGPQYPETSVDTTR